MKKKGLCLFFLVFLCVCISPGKHLFAQKFNIQQYTANTGLPSNNVFDVEFDDDGNIWFATSDGVVKYDGAIYRTFNQDDGLVDPVLFDIFIDDAGTLWASTDLGGVAKYEQGKFVYPQELDWIDTTIVHYIGQDNEGNLWLSLDNAGFVILDREDLSIKQKITTEQGLPSDLMFHFNFQYSDRVFISTYAGVAVYSYADNAIVDVWNMADGLIGEKTYEVLIDQQENIWIGTDQGVSVIHPDGSTTNKETVANYRLGYVFAIEQSYDGKIWIGTDRSGLFWINGEQETHITVRNGISSNNIFNLSKSPTGEIWISTNGNGVNIFIDDEFKIYDESSELDAYSATTVLQAKDGAIWVSTEHGISSFVDGAFKNYPILLESFENELILRSAELPNGNILMITNNYSLIEFDGERFFESEYANLLSGELISEIDVIDETIWFMALRHVISDTDGEIRYHSPETTDQWKTEFNYIYKDSRGLIWMGTQGGLVHYRDDNFTYYTISDGLRNNRVSHINEDESGNLWIAHNAGIDILRGINDDGNFEEVVPFETADLYIDETNFLQFDAAGNLWQGTDAGLNYYNLDAFEETGTYQHINIPLQYYGNGTEFSTYGSVLSNDTTLYFGTYNSGLVSYKFTNGENQLVQEEAPKVIIRSIMAGTEQVYNQEENDSDIELIEVENSQNSITIKLSALSEKYPMRINYRYRLSGLQDDWVVAENISQIRYESLPSGTFSLILQTKAPNTDWSTVQHGVRIVVKKPFYFQGWFLGLLLLAIVFLIYAIDKGRISLIEKNLLESKVDEQTKDIQKALDEKEVLIKEIHHRVKNNLAVISGLLDLQSRQIEEGPATEALQNSMTRVLAMAKIHEQLYQNEDLSNVNFKRFITNLVRSLDNTISNADHPILINEQVADISVDVNVGVPLGLMINEILSNSFKHAFEGQDAIHLATINIEFSKINDQFYHMRIADNGVGSAENLLEIEHQSLGMTLIKSWAMQLDAELSYDGANGAVFEAKIPV